MTSELPQEGVSIRDQRKRSAIIAIDVVTSASTEHEEGG